MNLSRLATYASLLTLTGMLLAILAVAVSEVHSFDVFWQLQNGRYMAETHSFIRTDLFTLAKDVGRQEHTWLHSLILFGLYKLAGYGAISILKGVLVTATLVVLICTARLRGASFAAIALVAPLFLLTSGGWLERPQLWTFLCFALFVCAFEQFLATRSWRILWLLPIALFWSNAHAGYVLAAAVFSAYLGGVLMQLFGERRLAQSGLSKLAVLAGGLLLAGAINPYALNLLASLIATPKIGGPLLKSTSSPEAAGQSSGALVHLLNMDWTPTSFQNEPLFFYTMGAVAVMLLLGWRRLRWSDLFLLGGLALMGMKLVRHIPFFYMAVLAFCPAYLDAAVAPLKKRLPQASARLAALVVLIVAIGLFSWLYRPLYKVYGPFNTGLREWHYPIAATAFVAQHQLPKNLYNTYDWGGYMAFKLYPDYLMFWDGRQNSTEMFSLGWNVMAGKPDWQQILDRFEVKTIVTRASTIDTGQKYPLLDRLRLNSDWSLVFSSESSMVFVKNDSVPADWLKRYARPKELIDDTVLSEAHLMVGVNANRFMAWWEMAQIYAKRNQYQNALFAVNQHLARAPQQNPAAIRLKQQLTHLVP